MFKKFIAICGMVVGAVGILAPWFIYRVDLDVNRQLGYLMGPDQPAPYGLFAITAILGVAVIYVAFDFGFGKQHQGEK